MKKKTNRKLFDIINGASSGLSTAWDTAPIAADNKPIPRGEYACRVLSGECFESVTNRTPGYKVTFEVKEGEHAGRRVWHDVWLTEAAMPHTKRDLAKMGICDLKQLDQPLPPGMCAKVRVTIHVDDTGRDYNKVQRFDVTGIDVPAPNPFAPTNDPPPPPPPLSDAATTPREATV